MRISQLSIYINIVKETIEYQYYNSPKLSTKKVINIELKDLNKTNIK